MIFAIRILRIAGCALALSIATGLPSSSPGADSEILAGKVVSVTDGDTLDLLVDGRKVRIRLAQIDAPEKAQPYGKRSTAALYSMAFGKSARVVVVDVDRYGRSIGDVYVGDLYVNREMVRRGHAWAYTRFSPSVEILDVEDAARAEERGLWTLPESERDAPWIWRHSRRKPTRADAAADAECGSKRTCGEMESCAEARSYLEKCGLSRLDGDGDGIPCESLCRR